MRPQSSQNKKHVLPHVICVEGNIGSGKSTLLEKLSKAGYIVIPEPIEHIWGQYLPKLYEDLQRWGFCFQMEVMDWFRQLHRSNLEKLAKSSKRIPAKKSSHQNEHQEIKMNSSDEDSELINLQQQQHGKDQEKNKQKREIILVERSAMTAFEIFSKNLKANGNMSDWEFSLLQRFYQLVDWEPKYTLYLQCDPEICISRIHHRNRDGENKVDKKLVESLHERHELLFSDQENSLPCDSQTTQQSRNLCQSKVLIVDGNGDKDRVFKDTTEKIDQIKKLLQQ